MENENGVNDTMEDARNRASFHQIKIRWSDVSGVRWAPDGKDPVQPGLRPVCPKHYLRWCTEDAWHRDKRERLEHGQGHIAQGAVHRNGAAAIGHSMMMIGNGSMVMHTSLQEQYGESHGNKPRATPDAHLSDHGSNVGAVLLLPPPFRSPSPPTFALYSQRNDHNPTHPCTDRRLDLNSGHWPMGPL